MKQIAFILLLSLMAVACDDYDCTLNNAVQCNLAFYNSDGLAVQLNDTLDIIGDNQDAPLLNKGLQVSQTGVALSYFKDKDTLHFCFYGEGYDVGDWIVIEKRNIEHFESLDCPVKMFHEITKVTAMTHNVIDSVALTDPMVQYENGENIKIYLRTSDSADE